MRKNSGFSLMELMVTIAIISILAGLAVPNFISWLPNYRLRSGAEDIQSTLQLARVTAIKRNATATVSFDIANETYHASVGVKTIRSGKMPAGIDIFSATFGGGTFVQFDSQGTAINNTNGSAQVINNAGRAKTITVYITGNSRIN